ncbi:MAG: ATP-binding protein, partial [Methanoculleaceae archaeon]
EVILMDTQAGVEHFGRAIAQGFDHALLVTDPTFNAVQVVRHSAILARDLGIPDLHLVINRVRSGDDVRKVREILGDDAGLFDGQFTVPFEEKMSECEPAVAPLLDEDSPFTESIRKIQAALAAHQG